MNNNKELDFAVQVARKAGAILMNYYGKELVKKIKSDPDDYATDADLESERYIVDVIKAQYPDDSIVAEESGQHDVAGSAHTWIIDPLDGTTNFVNKSDSFGVFIARTKGQNIELAVAFEPRKKMLATALKNGGTYLNEKKIELAQTLQNDLPLSVNQELHEKLHYVGTGGTDNSAIGPTLNTLRGKAKGYVVDVGLAWDFAAPSLLFSEAGWTVTNLKGTEYKWDGVVEFGYPGIVAAPAELHTHIMELLAS